MSDVFVPLARPAAAAPKTNGFAALGLKVVPQPANQSAAPQSCGEPVLTLQRDGDKITSIHVECSCGQVFDLACEY